MQFVLGTITARLANTCEELFLFSGAMHGSELVQVRERGGAQANNNTPST